MYLVCSKKLTEFLSPGVTFLYELELCCLLSMRQLRELLAKM